MSSFLNIGGLVGLVVGAGFCGGWLARYKASEMERRVESRWSAWGRAIYLENIGFFCGALGGAVALFAVWMWGWLHVP